MKNALLHCSYAAPVRVSDIDIGVEAARAVTGVVVVVRAVNFCVVRSDEAAARDVETLVVGRPVASDLGDFCVDEARDAVVGRGVNVVIRAVVALPDVVVR